LITCSLYKQEKKIKLKCCLRYGDRR